LVAFVLKPVSNHTFVHLVGVNLLGVELHELVRLTVTGSSMAGINLSTAVIFAGLFDHFGTFAFVSLAVFLDCSESGLAGSFGDTEVLGFAGIGQGRVVRSPCFV